MTANRAEYGFLQPIHRITHFAKSYVESGRQIGNRSLEFIIIHPDDRKGRIARTLCEMLLAQSDDAAQPFYTLSSQILTERKA